MSLSPSSRLQVQIAAFGQQGIDRVAAHRHPRTQGVSWLVCLQCPDGNVTVPDSLTSREDFHIVTFSDTGLSRNRNHALDLDLPAELILIGDDDVDYDGAALQSLIGIFEADPTLDIVCCRFLNNGNLPKIYGQGVFPLNKPPKGWFPSSIEMAFRRKSLGEIRFNENFGIGSGRFVAGEETVLLTDLLRRGRRGIGAPVVIGSHNDPTTSSRLRESPDFLRAHGAVMAHVHRITWLPRLIAHALKSPVPFSLYMRHTLSGAIYALTHRLHR